MVIYLLLIVNEALEQGYIQSNAKKIQIKNILITHGTADKSAHPKGSQEMYELLKQNTKYVTLKLYNGGYHEGKLNSTFTLNITNYSHIYSS
jgi:predicted esterase